MLELSKFIVCFEASFSVHINPTTQTTNSCALLRYRDQRSAYATSETEDTLWRGANTNPTPS